jgi:methyl-accepting chemotaxis protein
MAVSVQQMSLNSNQQAIAVSQVLEAMTDLKQAAVQAASGISQTKVGTQKLNETAKNLKALV